MTVANKGQGCKDKYFVAVTFNTAKAAQLSSRKCMWLFYIFNPILDRFIHHLANGVCKVQCVVRHGFALLLNHPVS